MGVKGNRSRTTLKKKRVVKKKKGLTHADLVDKGVRWVRSQSGKRWNAPLSFGELVHIGDETPDVMGFSSHGSTLIECKVSKADFKRDKKKLFRSIPQRGMGKYRLYMCPTDLIKVDELPDDWGLIYVSDKGIAKLIVKPKAQYCNLISEHAYMYSIIRRLYKGKTKDIQSFFKKYC